MIATMVNGTAGRRAPSARRGRRAAAWPRRWWSSSDQTALWPAGAGHAGRGRRVGSSWCWRRLVDENELIGIDERLCRPPDPAPRRDVWTVLLSGAERFLNDRP